MAQPWMPDAHAPACLGCKRPFTGTFRRHHCRLCGKVFCGDCTNRTAPVPYGLVVVRPGEMINMMAVMTHQWKVVRLCGPCFQVNEQKRAEGAAKNAAVASGGVQRTPTAASPANMQVSGVQVATPSHPSQQPQTYGQPQPAMLAAQQNLAAGGAQQVVYAASPVASQPQGQVAPDYVGHVAHRVVPPVELLDGPPIPANPGDLPPFPGKTAVERGDLFGMLGMGLAMAAAANTHQRDPHLSAEDNSMALGSKIRDLSGRTSQANTLTEAISILQQHHLPQGITAGFVITDQPVKGTLGSQYGLAPYDFIYGWESVLCTPDTTPRMLSTDMQGAFVTKGFFSLMVYSFVQRRYRRVNVSMPPGKPTAILGVATAQIPPSNAIPGVAEPSDDIYVKAWRKNGPMYISAGNNAVPLYAPLTSENADLYVKIARNRGGMWISTGEYHPIYDYLRLNEPLFAEAWRYRNGMLIRSGSEYAQLPMERVTVAAAPSPQMMPVVPQQQCANPAPAPAPSYAQQPPQENPYVSIAPPQNPYQAMQQPQQAAYQPAPQPEQQIAYQQPTVENPYAQIQIESQVLPSEVSQTSGDLQSTTIVPSNDGSQAQQETVIPHETAASEVSIETPVSSEHVPETSQEPAHHVVEEGAGHHFDIPESPESEVPVEKED